MYCFHYFTRHRRRRSSEPALKEELKSQNSEVNGVTKSLSSSTSPRGIPELYEEKAHNLRVFSFAELQRSTNNFSRLLKIGEGGFGSVYKGSIQAPDGNKKELISVAIKRLDPDGFQGHKQWLAEVQFLGVVEHPNLVKLIGYCAVDNERGIQRLLVYEYMPNKSLEYHLFNTACDSLPWKTRLEIVLGAAQGLAYLHEELEVQVIYRDFKTSNVLLDENFRPKLSDFGLAREGPITGHTHVSTAVMGTYGYAAPDYIETGHLTTKSDVWSFGVVLYEILTGRRSLDRNRPKTEQKLLEWVKQHPTNRSRFRLIIDPRLEGQYSMNGARDIAKLADDCLSKSAKERPRMSQVVERLKQIIINSYEDNPDEKNINLFANDELLDQEEKPNQPNPSKLWRRRMNHLAKLGEHVDTAIGRRLLIQGLFSFLGLFSSNIRTDYLPSSNRLKIFRSQKVELIGIRQNGKKQENVITIHPRRTRENERGKRKKKFGPFLDLCVSSLRRGHANLLCIVPILSDVPEGTLKELQQAYIKNVNLITVNDVGFLKASMGN